MSAYTLRRTLLGLTLLGVGVATYLTYIHYAGIKPLCGRNGGGCEIVQTSEYSKLAGVPVALIGLIGYVAILASLAAPESENTRLATVALAVVGIAYAMRHHTAGKLASAALARLPPGDTRSETVALAVVGFAFSAYLTYREIFSIHHICEWCISSFVIVWLIMCLAIWRFLRGDGAPEAPIAHPEVAAPERATGVSAVRS